MKLNKLPLNVIGLNRVGLNQIGSPSHRANTSDRPYIDPEVLASLVAVCICDGKSNDDPDRAVIKNLVDPDNPFIISNAAYKLNSGYGKYEEDFTTWVGAAISINNGAGFKIERNNTGWWGFSTYGVKATNEFKIKVTNCRDAFSWRYKDAEGIWQTMNITKDGIYTLPASQERDEHDAPRFFNGNPNATYNGLTVEQIPSYQGAFVTDGKDDLIASTKTVSEMGITDEVTVVSLVHQVSLNSTYNKAFTNYLEILDGSAYIRNDVVNGDKTGIYGYTSKLNANVAIVINNILGDKSDYGSYSTNIYNSLSNTKFSVVGRISEFRETSSVAWYWTFIANKVLTTDQINQVISYFNLDKHVKPDVYYDVKKQGLSNDTPEADWYLKDFSGNGHDMQLYNFAKKLGSGVGKYAEDFTTWTPQSYVADSTYTSNKLHITNIKGGNAILYTKKGANAMKVKITGIQSFNLVYRYIAENDVWEALEVDRDGIYELPASTTTTKTYYTGFTVPYYTGDCDITIEQIPDYEGALVSDGIDDYGKVENLPIYKDYTVVADREIVDGLIDNAGGGVAIRSYNYAKGAFGFDWKNQAFSFGGNTDRIIDVQRFISYQSKYINNGIQLITGNVVDNNPLYMARLGEENRYSKLALWSFLLFPYSLSEFLLERQLKRYKLGTLYPDMVEFRPVISGNIPYNAIEISQGSTTLYNKSINKTGIYLQEGSTVRVYIQPSGIDEVSKITVNGVEYTDLPINPNGFYYADFPIAKSPQKISYAIDEYIRYEDIVQPYPAIINLKQDGKTITWGDKLKVGSDIVFAGSANLLPELYTVSDTRYNGVTLYPNTIIKVEKSMVFDNARTYLKANEPSCILSPNRLRIPNSSYKILGYIPDLTGKGNHGKLNNFAYTEDSGVAADGSVKFDGTDDHITIPTLAHGGKCVMMKVNSFETVNPIYEQRNPNIFSSTFCIFMNSGSIVYVDGNNGKTYIDGVLNSSITGNNLVNILHNITVTNENITTANSVSPKIGVLNTTNTSYADMAMYEFMLFPEIPSEDEIKKLNDVMGIEGGYVESPDYYWDAYGKANKATQDIDYLDLNQASNAHQILIDKSKAGLAALDLYHSTGNVSELINRRLNLNNFAYTTESGYSKIADTRLFNQWIVYTPNTMPYIERTLINDSTIRITKSNIASVDSFFVRTNINKKAYYKITGLQQGQAIQFGYTNDIIYTAESDGVYEVDWSLTETRLYQELGCTFVGDCNITIEQVAQYQNGLVSDGVDDYLINTVIPAFTDFTVIAKRQFLNNTLQNNETFCLKGDKLYPSGVGNAFVMEYYYGTSNYLLSFGGLTDLPLETSKISYITPTSYNGNNAIRGNGDDNVGLMIGKCGGVYWKGVFYKVMLYSKTIDQLSINMLKNLFERDELIDVTNPIFKKQ